MLDGTTAGLFAVFMVLMAVAAGFGGFVIGVKVGRRLGPDPDEGE